MRIVITGASGFIGQNIVPFLTKNGAEILLVGRDIKKLQRLFPNKKVTDYDGLKVEAKGCDCLIHLAVKNNTEQGTLEDFFEINVNFLNKVLQTAISAKIKNFIHISTMQTIDSKNKTPYAQSKREAEILLSNNKEITIANLQLPIVYGEKYIGKLKFINKLPKTLRPLIFQILASLKPSVHADKLNTAILEIIKNPQTKSFTISDRQKGNWFYAFIKRAIDLSFVLFVILFLWWLLIITWISIKITSSGPAIFVQQRIGKNGRVFILYKFRTMKIGTEQVGTHEVAKSRLTKVGIFLRKSKIDELPQIINILRNELSLVGPRPCLPNQKELIAARKELSVLDIKGGITGWSQIHGVDMSDPERLAKLDAQYMDLSSLILDIKIILATMFGRGQGDRVK